MTFVQAIGNTGYRQRVQIMVHRSFWARALLMASAFTILPAAAAGQPPAAQAASGQKAKPDLATPPAQGTTTYSLTSIGGNHGRVAVWRDTDGTLWARYSLLLRGFVTELEYRARLRADGTFEMLEIKGVTPSGDAAEQFSVAGERASYRSPVDSGEAGKAGMYFPYGGYDVPAMIVAEALYRMPGRSVALLPSGRATLRPLTTLKVEQGGRTKTLTAYTIDGLNIAPQPIWFDGDRFFGLITYLNMLPAGWESIAPELSRAQEAALAERAPAMLAELAPRQVKPVVFENVRIYDAAARSFREGMTVIASGGTITTVAPARARFARPADATVFDGKGKTLVPGMWDAHMHYGFFSGDLNGPLLLASGITSVRDPGNRPDGLIARKQRIDEGRLLGPHIIAAMMIDGPGPMAAQLAVIVDDEASAVAAVRNAKQMGFAALKLYGSLDKALVAPIAAEARRLGMGVLGHLPAGMRPLDAVRAGYGEITHINMAMMQFMPDAVVAGTNNLQRFYGPGLLAKDVNLGSPQVTAFIDELRRRGTAVDPTLTVFENGYVLEPGEPQPAYRNYDGLLPPVFARSLKAGGFAATPEVDRAAMRASFRKLQAFTVALYRAGIPIVAGTDGYGPEMVRDLELYVEGGLTPGEALATATIIPAQVFGTTDRGAIVVGARSDLVLVDGDVSRDIGALRQVDRVMMGDRLMDGAALRKASGILDMPASVPARSTGDRRQ